MSSWANLGLSALSNVTQSVHALSSYAKVVLHEAREEVGVTLHFDLVLDCVLIRYYIAF
jgi:hypothetical protein